MKKYNYKTITEILKSYKLYALIIFYMFIGFMILGYLFPNFLEQYQDSLIKNILENLKNKNMIETILFIIFNNLKTAGIGLLFGSFFALVPLIAIAFNGFIVGSVSYNAINKSGTYLTLFRLLPHGIFEIPAICLSFGIGVKLGIEILYYFIFGLYEIVQEKDYKKFKNRSKEILNHYIDATVIFITIIIPLIIIAGIIEGTLYYYVK